MDIDYQQQTGYMGTGIAGAYIGVRRRRRIGRPYSTGHAERGRVAPVTNQSLQLDGPLLGGVPAGTARVQKVAGFVDREGGNFFRSGRRCSCCRQPWAGEFAFTIPDCRARVRRARAQ